MLTVAIGGTEVVDLSLFPSFSVLGFESRSSLMLGKSSAPELHPTVGDSSLCSFLCFELYLNENDNFIMETNNFPFL